MQRAPVSVVVPYFRGAATLPRAIASVQRQTVPPAEIVIVDDASPEPLPDALPEGPVPVRTLRLERNRGIPGARNAGVDAAASEWVAFLDQDDEWLPWKLEEQLAAARRARAGDVIYSRCEFAGAGDRRAGHSLPPRGCARDLAAGGARALDRLLRRGNVIPFITVLVRRDALLEAGGLDERYTGGTDDSELMLRFATRGARFLLASPGRRVAALHHHTGRNYSDPARWIDEEARAFDELASRHAGLGARLDIGRSRSHFRYARHLAHRGEHDRAIVHYREAARLDRAWLKPRAALILAALR